MNEYTNDNYYTGSGERPHSIMFRFGLWATIHCLKRGSRFQLCVFDRGRERGGEMKQRGGSSMLYQTYVIRHSAARASGAAALLQ